MKNKVLQEIVELLKDEIVKIKDIDEQIDTLNEVRWEIHSVSPLKHHPADCVLWEKSEFVEIQKTNVNVMASPESELLYQSIINDGYTMPCPIWKQPDGILRIVDGSQRRRMEREHKDISESTFARIPTTRIRQTQEGDADRIASMVRHNRSRGSHDITLMSQIVGELVEAGMSDAWVQKHLGFDREEMLRLKQITGLASLFHDVDFSKAWDEKKVEVELDDENEGDE